MEWKKLPEVCDIKTGKKDANHAKENGKYRFYTCANHYSLCDTYSFSGESIIVPGNGDIGLVFYYDGDFEAYQRTYVLSNIKICAKYLYYYFVYKWRSQNTSKQFGSTVKYVRMQNFNDFIVPVPPFPEQQRIVAKIEELFAELDNSVAMLKKVKEQINQFNESLMEQIFQQSDCSWEEYKLGDEKICSINKNFNLPDFEDEDIVSFLPMAAVEAKTNKFYPQTTTYGKVKKGYTKFRNGDVLFAKITPCMENGKICIVNDLIKDCGFGSTEFHVLRCSENLLPKFLYYFVSRENFLRRAVPYMTGSVGQKRMPSDYLAEQKIKVPSIDVQKQIINCVADKISKSKSIDNILDSVLVSCDALRQSILKKAFGGEL